jgi:mevalonate kinase
MTQFPSKIILFGEYATLVGAPALALPLPQFGAEWTRDATTVDERARRDDSQRALWKLLFFLQEKKEFCDIDIPAFQAALNSGFWLKSNVPSGYGLGSSGTVVAAIYHEFCAAPIADLVALRSILAEMESFFHGTSSGIDPLISFVKTPMLIKNRENIVKTNISQDILKHFFIINTQKARRTETFVDIFKQKVKNDAAFAEYCMAQLLPTTAACIDAVLQNDSTTLYQNLTDLSAQQLANFQPMIPENMIDFWKKGLDSDNFKVKLCGAGGGGFLMGFAHDFSTLPEPLKPIILPLCPQTNK